MLAIILLISFTVALFVVLLLLHQLDICYVFVNYNVIISALYKKYSLDNLAILKKLSVEMEEYRQVTSPEDFTEFMKRFTLLNMCADNLEQINIRFKQFGERMWSIERYYNNRLYSSNYKSMMKAEFDNMVHVFDKYDASYIIKKL
jgi:hypothetical protein